MSKTSRYFAFLAVQRLQKVLCLNKGLFGVAVLKHAINCTRGTSVALFYLEKLKESGPVFGTLSGMIETLQ